MVVDIVPASPRWLQTIIPNLLGENWNVHFFETHLTSPFPSDLVADAYWADVSSSSVIELSSASTLHPKSCCYLALLQYPHERHLVFPVPQSLDFKDSFLCFISATHSVVTPYSHSNTRNSVIRLCLQGSLLVYLASYFHWTIPSPSSLRYLSSPPSPQNALFFISLVISLIIMPKL